jgi:hypothetical protein
VGKYYRKDKSMSGGHFYYKQHNILDILHEVEELIEKNNIPDEYGYVRNYPESVINEFKNAIPILQQAYDYVHAIDWLVSDDDGVDEFLKKILSCKLKRGEVQ